MCLDEIFIPGRAENVWLCMKIGFVDIFLKLFINEEPEKVVEAHGELKPCHKISLLIFSSAFVAG